MKTLLVTSIKNKITHSVLAFNQSQWIKQHIELNTQKRIDNENKDGKALYKLENNAIFKITMKSL